jgi:uncharacterized protein
LSADAYRFDAQEAEQQKAASPIFLQSLHGYSCVSAASDIEERSPHDIHLDAPSADVNRLVITDEVLLNYQRCQRRAYLDSHGDRTLRDQPTDYLLKLRQDSLGHQLQVLNQYQSIHQPSYTRHNWEAGVEATLNLMRQGVDQISQGVLHLAYSDQLHFISYPKLLTKQPGSSFFGDWIYVPVDIKLGKRPKLDYQIVSAFHAYLLAFTQGAWPESSGLILRQQRFYEVDLTVMLPKMEEVLHDCLNRLRSPQEPEVFISHSRCDLCHWYSHCYSQAQQEKHLSLLPGVTPTRYEQLQAMQLVTLEALAATPPKSLEGLPGFGSQVAHKLVRQAQSTLRNEALPCPDNLHRMTTPPERLLTPEELPTAAVELYFDIEAAPEYDLIYLHGVLVVDRMAGTQEFHALLAEAPDQERAAWEQFLDLVWRYPHAPIFHFCPYEVQTIHKLAKAYQTPFHLIEPVVERCVDLHERITRVVAMPIESYALKSIARWIGFDWHDQDANGAKSIYWYDRWMNTGDRSFLNAILRYNEDDCRATYHVKDWLIDFIEQQAIAVSLPPDSPT